MFACTDVPLKMYEYVLLESVSSTHLITFWAENRLFTSVRFSKLVQFHIHPLLNIFTLPEWLNVKFHHYLISSKVKILNTVRVNPLATIHVTSFPVS